MNTRTNIERGLAELSAAIGRRLALDPGSAVNGRRWKIVDERGHTLCGARSAREIELALDFATWALDRKEVQP